MKSVSKMMKFALKMMNLVEIVGAIGGFGLFVLPCVVYVNLRYVYILPLLISY